MCTAVIKATNNIAKYPKNHQYYARKEERTKGGKTPGHWKCRDRRREVDERVYRVAVNFLA